MEVNQEQVEVTPKNVYCTKYTQLARVTVLSKSPMLRVLCPKSKKSPEIISFIHWIVNQNHHNYWSEYHIVFKLFNVFNSSILINRLNPKLQGKTFRNAIIFNFEFISLFIITFPKFHSLIIQNIPIMKFRLGSTKNQPVAIILDKLLFF